MDTKPRPKGVSTSSPSRPAQTPMPSPTPSKHKRPKKDGREDAATNVTVLTNGRVITKAPAAKITRVVDSSDFQKFVSAKTFTDIAGIDPLVLPEEKYPSTREFIKSLELGQVSPTDIGILARPKILRNGQMPTMTKVYFYVSACVVTVHDTGETSVVCQLNELGADTLAKIYVSHLSRKIEDYICDTNKVVEHELSSVEPAMNEISIYIQSRCEYLVSLMTNNETDKYLHFDLHNGHDSAIPLSCYTAVIDTLWPAGHAPLYPASIRERITQDFMARCNHTLFVTNRQLIEGNGSARVTSLAIHPQARPYSITTAALGTEDDDPMFAFEEEEEEASSWDKSENLWDPHPRIICDFEEGGEGCEMEGSEHGRVAYVDSGKRIYNQYVGDVFKEPEEVRKYTAKVKRAEDRRKQRKAN